MEIAIENIIDNACKYRIGKNNAVTIKVHKLAQDSVIIEVINLGYKIMDPQKIKEMGNRGENIKKKIGGEGFGLMISSIIIESLLDGQLIISPSTKVEKIYKNKISIILPLVIR